MNGETRDSYVLGRTQEETGRLKLQATFLRPITERMLRAAGISAGMRVLDLGCGAGDVTTLAAEIVGASGAVVGIDVNADVLTEARQRAREAGLAQVSFEHADIAGFEAPTPFDAVIGRYLLIHVSDPAEVLRAARSYVRPGGVVAFHELDLVHSCSSCPEVPAWDQLSGWLYEVFRRAAPSHDVAVRLVQHFHTAGLPTPELFCEVPTSGSDDSLLYRWAAQSAQTLKPHIVGLGLADADAIPDTLADDLRRAILERGSQVTGPAQICAWARRAG